MNIDDLYRMFVEKTSKIRLLRNQINKTSQFIFGNSGFFIFRIFKSRVSFIFKIFKPRVLFISFIKTISQTRITSYFKPIDLLVEKSSNTATCEALYDSKKLSIRFSHAQIQTFARSFFYLLH